MSDMNGKEVNENAPFCGLENGLDPKVNYDQKFVYPSPKTLPNPAPKGMKTR